MLLAVVSAGGPFRYLCMLELDLELKLELHNPRELISFSSGGKTYPYKVITN